MNLTISSPVITVGTPYSPYFSFPVVLHCYTWQTELQVNFSFPEGYMGSVEEQKEWGRPSLVTWADETIRILEEISAL